MRIKTLGKCRVQSPLGRSVSEDLRVLGHIVQGDGPPAKKQLFFERAGPRARLYFNPADTIAGVVTCGGLCPGLNNVIRSLFLEMHHFYGVKSVLGFRNGYQGLDPACGLPPIELTCEIVDKIHREGGTILGTSRGPVEIGAAIENLARKGVNILFTVGGDGTQRGARELALEAQKRGYPLAVVGIPKTIDNDVPYVSRTFGYLTAIEIATEVLHCAHTECHSVQNGVSIVKLMGRQAGFIAAGATVASQDVNFTLIPEVPFKLDGPRGFLEALKARILKRSHALIVVAEGAGQDLLATEVQDRDASGNVKLKDIGQFLRMKIESFFKSQKIPVTIRYLDPSYVIRSVPADAEDSMICDLFARHAVHAAMAGKTGLVIGYLHDEFIHVPIELITGERKRLNPNGSIWHATLAATGQPAAFS